MLEHCKSLDMNDFLHDFCPYIVNRPRIERCLVHSSQQSDPSSGAPPVRTFVEFNIFGDDQENVEMRPRVAAADPPNWDTLFPSGGVRINKFGTNDGAEYIKDAAFSSVDPRSWNRGYRARA
jgi:hypothetical protein